LGSGPLRRLVFELVLAEIALDLHAGLGVRPPGEEDLPAFGTDESLLESPDSSFDRHRHLRDLG
jgi:hypothetical protein